VYAGIGSAGIRDRLEGDEMSQDPMREHESRSDEAEQEYEAPSVEEISTEDAPAVTAAGEDITGPF
jgi:hypothetical protein